MTTEKQRASAHMATAALVLSIISLAASCCIYLSLVCGALSIILAGLSAPHAKIRPPMANAAIILSILGMVATIGITVFAFAVTISQYGSIDAFMTDYDALYRELLDSYGLSGSYPTSLLQEL